ncbi:MAG: hypothetical protein WDN75_08655 [Bacteroidota bacterium]
MIIDNFQLISYPIYGGMDLKVENEKGQNFKFDVAAWKGHKAYIEILPGTFTQHVYRLPKDSYVEVEYAIAFNGEWIEPAMKEYGDDVLVAKQAIEHWTDSETSPQQVKLLNELLKRKILAKQFPVVADLLASNEKLEGALSDSAFFNGVNEGFAINSPVFKRGSHKEMTATGAPEISFRDFKQGFRFSVRKAAAGWSWQNRSLTRTTRSRHV